MKVLLIHNAYQKHLKGGEDAVFEREKKALEHKLGVQNVLSLTLSNDDIQLWKLPFQIWSNRAFAKKVTQLCQQHQVDLVHVHNFFPLVTPSVFLAAKRSGAKVIQTLHNYRWWCLSGTFFYQGKICKKCQSKRLMWPGILRGCYRGSIIQSLLAGLAFAYYKRKKVMQAIDGFLVLSEHQRQQVSHVLPVQKVFLKPNAIDIKTIKPFEKRGFVFVGRLEEGKGISLLCDVWESLGEKAPSLTVIGDGPLRDDLERKYKHLPIVFMGTQSKDNVNQALAQAKFCIHPSLYYETFGLVILEAMAVGTPVIGFDIGTRSELIEHGVNGVLSSPSELKQTLLTLDLFNYSALSKQAILFAGQFEEEHLSKKQLQIYDSVKGAA